MTFKIGIDCTNYIHGRAIGFNEYLFSLLHGLSLLKDDSFHITLYVLKGQANEFKASFSNLDVIELSFKSKFMVFFIHNFLFYFFQRQHDVILFPANFLPLLFPSKSVIVVHDLNFLFNPASFSFAQLWYRHIFSKRSIIHASAVISISNQVAKEIFYFSRRSSYVIHNPVMIEALPESPLGNFILCPSSLAAYKNINSAIEACQRFVLNNPESDLFFVFIGNWKPSAFNHLDLCKRIKMLGFVSISSRLKLFSTCSAVLVPSYYEGFGMPYLESLICAKPLICCDIPIAREVVGSYPYFIGEPFGAQQIFLALNTIYQTNFRVRPFDPKFVANVQPENAAKKYLNILQSLFLSSLKGDS